MPRSPRRPAGDPPMRHSRRRAETSSRGLDGRRNEFLEAPRDAPRTRPGEVVRRRPRGVPDGARRKPWKVPAVTLDDHLRGASRTPTASSATTPPGGFRRPLGQSLGTRRHDRSEGSQPTPSIPPGRSSAVVRETLAEPLGGLPHDPSDRSRRTSPRARPPRSQEARQTTSTRTLSTLRKGLRKTSPDHSASSASTLHGALADHRNTHAQYAPKRVSERPRGTTARAPPPPSAEAPQTTHALAQHSPKRVFEDPAGPLRELRHHPPRSPHRPPQHPSPPPPQRAPDHLNTLAQHPPK